MDAETSVQVALRIRPQNASEQVEMCRVCTFVTPGEPQIILGKDKAFTYDHVFDVGTEQQEIYGDCVENLVEGCFSGFNATVLAYGQTGSGKTYTMGTGFDVTMLPEEKGMVPRALKHLFDGIDDRKKTSTEQGIPPPQFDVAVEFLELYNEEIKDLFNPSRDPTRKLKIHESLDGEIYVEGAVEQKVHTEQETVDALKQGALSRTVGSTNMNAQSSRSHAIFTLTLKQQRPVLNADSGGGDIADWETLTAKFHFVDLAGSERLKRTGATGERAKEGISINCGLLSLGNVISALGDKSKKGSHVPYRDSKLTRLLQDSLGGNSRTLMIACISPTDRDFMETLNTLKYANRARNIKNKVVVNQDKASAQLATLRAQVQELELELQEFRAGRLVVSDSGSVVVHDLSSEVTMLKADNDKLRLRLKAMQQVVDAQSERLAWYQTEKDIHNMSHQDHSTGQEVGSTVDNEPPMQSVVQQYILEIEKLRSQLILQQQQQQLSAPPTTHQRRPLTSSSYASSSSLAAKSVHTSSSTSIAHQPIQPIKEQTTQLLAVAKQEIGNLREKRKGKAKSSHHHSSSSRKRDSSSSSPERTTNYPVEAWLNSVPEDRDDDDDDTDTEVNEEEDEDEVSLSCTSDSDEEEEEEDLDDTASIATSIAELTSEISIKQQLVEQLERSQQSLQTLRTQYEEKMTVLLQQIKATESERDRVLKEIAQTRLSERREEKIKEMKSKYERQLGDMKRELKQLQLSKKEHSKAMKKNAQQERELRQMKIELEEMKKQKVKMIRKMKDDTSSRKVTDARKERELSKIRNENRKKEHLIKSLQADARKKEVILRRKQDEVKLLRRQQYGRSRSAGSNLKEQGEPANQGSDPTRKRRKSSQFSSMGARSKWRDMQKIVREIISRRQTQSTMEHEMDNWVKKRQELSHKAEGLTQQRDTLQKHSDTDPEALSSIEDELEGAMAQISWANDNIEKLQEDIVTFEDMKFESDTLETAAIIQTCSAREAKYLLEHLITMSIDQGLNAMQRDTEVKSLQLRLATSEQHAELIKMYSSPHLPPSPLVVNSRTVTKITHTSTTVSSSPPKLVLDEPSEPPVQNGSDNIQTAKTLEVNGKESEKNLVKQRRRTALPVDLRLGHRRQPSDPPCPDKLEFLDTDCSSGTSSSSLDSSGRNRRHRRSSEEPSSGAQHHNSKKSMETLTEPSERQVAVPQSPVSTKRPRSDVIADSGRQPQTEPLTSSSSSRSQFEAERISSAKSGKILVCSHTAKGHSGGVLSLAATDCLLFSASQDCTVKVWDLTSGQEVSCLGKHHSYVRKVAFCPQNNLVFTTCQSLIKIWDQRAGTVVKTFSSPPWASTGRSSDTLVQDLLVSHDGKLLYSASGNAVNVWDLTNLQPIGRLVGHSGTVSTMAFLNEQTLATGARDRLIKFYDIGSLQEFSSGFAQPPISTLFPLHYDAVSALAVYSNALFSACGVSIKQWDVANQTINKAIDGAHAQSRQSNSITSLGLTVSVPLLVSACKSGVLKLWTCSSCQNIGEVAAHKSSINSIATNQDAVFTGSSDKTVRVWRPNPSTTTTDS